MKKLVIASTNPGKLRELEQMLSPLGIKLIAQSQLGIPEAAEPHATFVENALAKARHASTRARLPALADDSGICAAALNGAPGVRSARYAGASCASIDRDSQDARNNRKLIAALARTHDRRAHYYCVIVLVRCPDDPEPLIAEGRWEGEVITEPRGSNGFGYDPYFYLPAFGRTAAELDATEKNAVSHRGQALQQLVVRLAAELAWLQTTNR
ncbi:MAG: RdgB/HAM1 family non-canonical purine NTP pyrophosphatase [Pseudomonadota bacterium]